MSALTEQITALRAEKEELLDRTQVVLDREQEKYASALAKLVGKIVDAMDRFKRETGKPGRQIYLGRVQVGKFCLFAGNLRKLGYLVDAPGSKRPKICGMTVYAVCANSHLRVC